MRLHEKYLVTEKVDENDIANYIRDEMSGTKRRATATEMLNDIKRFGVGFEKMKKAEFTKVWNRLVKEKYLKKISGDKYKWEI